MTQDDIIVLLGAGCSAEAGIPTSNDMVRLIEEKINNGEKQDGFNWGDYKDLYYCVKSSLLYGDGIKGIFGDNANYNIEKLVNALSELEKREDHPLFPFVASWNPKLLEVAGNDLKKITNLRDVIVKELKRWVTVDDYKAADYYLKLFEFQEQYQFRLRVFTLNYDLCVEKKCGDAIVERGFDDNRKWAWGRFEHNDKVALNIYLYKMHGSIDWTRDKLGNLTFSEEIHRVSKPDLIFGTNYKFQYTDPYLFFTSEFRRYTLESKLIIAIGYGFGDDHINEMIGQSLRTDPTRRILSASKIGNGSEKNEIELQRKVNLIRNSLKLQDDSQMVVKDISAKKFLNEELTIGSMKKIIPTQESLFKPTE